MKHVIQVFLSLLLVTTFSFSSAGIWQSYVIVNNGTTTYYHGGANGDATEATWLNATLGTFTTGSTLIISGGENKTYKNGGDDVWGCGMFYRIYKNGDTPPSFTEINLPFAENLVNAGDQRWATTSSNINVLSSVTSPGQWKIEVYWGIKINGSSYSAFDNNSGSNFTATFTADNTFPVELTSFLALARGNVVNLEWKTATETNNHGFEIEKKQSGAEWRTIGFKQGNGTTNNISNYSYTDNSVARGKVEYRLKQIDRDGKFSYSNTVEAFVGLSPNTVELTGNYPNPFNPSTSISFMLGTTGTASLKVYDLLGKEVAVIAQGIFNAGEMNTFNFNAAGLTSGAYYYRLTSDAKVETRKMMLMK